MSDHSAMNNEYLQKLAELTATGYKTLVENSVIDHPMYDSYEYFNENTTQEMLDKFGTTSWIDSIRKHPIVKRRCLGQVAGDEDEEGDAGDSWLTRHLPCDQKEQHNLYITFEAVKVLRIIRRSDESKCPEEQLLKFMTKSAARICHVLINDRTPHGDRKRVQPLMTNDEFAVWWEDRVKEAGSKAPTAKVILAMKNLAKERIEKGRATQQAAAEKAAAEQEGSDQAAAAAAESEVMAPQVDFPLDERPIRDITPEQLGKVTTIETPEEAEGLLRATLQLLKDKGMLVPRVNWSVPPISDTPAGKMQMSGICQQVQLECAAKLEEYGCDPFALYELPISKKIRITDGYETFRDRERSFFYAPTEDAKSRMLLHYAIDLNDHFKLVSKVDGVGRKRVRLVIEEEVNGAWTPAVEHTERMSNTYKEMQKEFRFDSGDTDSEDSDGDMP